MRWRNFAFASVQSLGRVEYRVRLDPDPGATTARVTARLTIRLNNTAPDSGLPQIVIGPYTSAFVAGVKGFARQVGAPGRPEAATARSVRSAPAVSVFTDAGVASQGVVVSRRAPGPAPRGARTRTA